MKIWKIIALFLLGGICFETGYIIITNRQHDRLLASERDRADGYKRDFDGVADYSESLEIGLDNLRREQDNSRARIDQLERRNKELEGYFSEQGDLNNINYQRYERLQDLLRELAVRATGGERAE